MRVRGLVPAAAALFLLCGCSPANDTVNIVVEDGSGYEADPATATIPVGGSIDIEITPKKDWVIRGCDSRAASLQQGDGGAVTISIEDVRYSDVIGIDAVKRDRHISYSLPDGRKIRKSYAATHLRTNTMAFSDELYIPGYTLVGWNSKSDLSGERIGLGSRIETSPGETKELFGDYRAWSDADLFITEEGTGETVHIVGIKGDPGEKLIVPAQIDGGRVSGIGDFAFSGIGAREVVLPPGLRSVGLHAFHGSAVESLTLFDDMESISDHAFSDCDDLREICINAARPPAYSGTYYDTFTDKYDRLLSLSDERKLVLFSGSSARFGYDSAMIDTALPEYEVVNMGVFAYTNALPQLELIRQLMGKGDILLLSPEFDAAKRQFCTNNKLDDKFFCMIESDYDLLKNLDYGDYNNVLSAFSEFLSIRRGMYEGDYEISAASFDEDKNPVASPSYNEYGDYVVYRENAADDTPIYDLPVDYVKEAYPYETVIAPFNRECLRFVDQGVEVLFTYAPRNSLAISDRSTPKERLKLHKYLCEKLRVPVISDIEESLYPGRYLFGTDNHLSTEGVTIRTERIIEDILKWKDK